MSRVGILYDSISGNTGDVAIGISVRKMLREIEVEFDELVPGNFNPAEYETIIIGGGVANGWDLFAKHMSHEVAERAFPLPAAEVKIVPAECGDDAGWGRKIAHPATSRKQMSKAFANPSGIPDRKQVESSIDSTRYTPGKDPENGSRMRTSEPTVTIR